ncbi:MAG: hypothetical protein Kow0056_00860 [Coriobacteriia bacterium]
MSVMKAVFRKAPALMAATVVVALTAALAGCEVGTQQSDSSFEGYGVEERAVSGTAPEAGLVAEDEAMTAPGEPPANGAGQDASTIPPEERLIIRDHSLRLEVEDVREAVADIRKAAGEAGAIITNLNIASDDGPIYRYDEYGYTTGSGAALSGWVTVRVPADSYESFVAEVSGLGEILWEGESTDDVTQQHVDLKARLENLQSEEVRLREFFDAAKDVDDMLAIENELARVRGEIESLQAQIAYLERQAAMATVTIELSEPEPVVRPEGPDWGFADAITSGLQLAANVVKGLIIVGLGALPLLVLAALAYFIVRAIIRTQRARRAARAQGLQEQYDVEPHTEAGEDTGE